MTAQFTWYDEARAKENGRGWHEGDEPLDFQDASIAMLDLTGTNLEEVIFAAVAGYLTAIMAGGNLYDLVKIDHAHALAAEIADRGGFIEYGTSARFAWATDEGKAWLVDYDADLAKESP